MSIRSLTFYEICNQSCQNYERIARDVLKKYGITFQQYAILEKLETSLKPGELSGLCQRSGGNITYLTDKMVKEELIERTPSNDDRRSFVIVRSKKGTAIFEKAKKDFEKSIHDELTISSRHLKSLENLMKKMGC